MMIKVLGFDNIKFVISGIDIGYITYRLLDICHHHVLFYIMMKQLEIFKVSW